MPETPFIPAESIIKIVREYMDVPKDYDFIHSRRRHPSEARMVAMALIYKYTSWRQRDIALYFNRDRATVAHNCQTVERWRESMPKFAEELAYLEGRAAAVYIQ